MRKKDGMAAIVLFCSLLLVCGCETVPRSQIVRDKTLACLTACVGKLTEDALIMKASTPAERVPVADGEIWIYKYRRSEVKTTAEGTGSLLFPVEVESKSNDYALDVRMRFNKAGILVGASFSGNVDMFNHPFADLNCQ